MRGMAYNHSESITPRWLGFDQAAIYSGLGIRVLQNHVKAGFIRSSNACAPGASRGRRLIDRESLDAFIEAGVGKTAVLAMNSGRGGAQ
jgi:hypothetical protein